MKFTCDDYKELKYLSTQMCSVGIFGEQIYAMKYFVTDGHNSYHSEYYKITKTEFAEYPLNGHLLIAKYYKGQIPFLCSDYLGHTHRTYSFDI